MKRKWCLQRQFVERRDGQRRWDNAYQLLMEITADASESSTSVQAQTDVVCKTDLPGESL